MTSIKDFIKTGKFNNISLGCSLDYLTSRLGMPDDTSIKQNPIIYKYGPIEISFLKSGIQNRVTSINILFNGNNQTKLTIITDWLEFKEITIKRLLDLSIEEELNLELDPLHSLDEVQIGFKNSNRIVVVFRTEGGLEELHGIYLA